MKTRILTLTVAMLAVCMSMNAFGDLLVHESFDMAAEGTLTGYAGNAVGLKDSWTTSEGDLEWATVRAEWEYVGIDGGYEPDIRGGLQHWWEHGNQWSTSVADRPLKNTIDMTQDGMWYISFFSMTGSTNFVVAAGLKNDANELMIGNGYDSGLTAYCRTLGTGDNYDNTNGSTISITDWETGLFVAKLVKTNSGTTDDLSVSIKFYNLGKRATDPLVEIDSDDTALLWNRTMALTGVSGVFHSLRLKLDGNGSNPSIDEIRIGETWGDVTFGYVGLVSPAPNGIGNTEGDVVEPNANLVWTNNHSWNMDVYLSGPHNDPNPAPILTQVIGNQAVVTSYDPPADLEYGQWYYWRVDAREPNMVGTMQDIIHQSPLWSFKPTPPTPVITSFDNVATALSLLPTTLSATVVNPLTTATFTLLEDDFEYPAGATVTLTPDVSDLAAPTVTVDADTSGIYKIKLVVSNGSESDEEIAEIVVYATTCEAAGNLIGGWTANYYDLDEDCDVDLNDFAEFAKAWLDDTGMTVQESYVRIVDYIPVDLIVALTNPSFEQPDEGKIWNDWGRIPGWSSDANPSDSGVEESNAATKGSYVGFLMDTDSSVWQTSGHTIVGDEVFELSFDAQNTSAFEASLYYVDGGGARVPLTTQIFVLTGSMTPQVLTFDVSTVPAAAGNLLGVEFDNVGSGWMQFDNVAIENSL